MVGQEEVEPFEPAAAQFGDFMTAQPAPDVKKTGQVQTSPLSYLAQRFESATAFFQSPKAAPAAVPAAATPNSLLAAIAARSAAVSSPPAAVAAPPAAASSLPVVVAAKQPPQDLNLLAVLREKFAQLFPSTPAAEPSSREKPLHMDPYEY
jgi:hypothetical protein